MSRVSTQAEPDCFEIVTLPAAADVIVDKDTAIYYGLKPAYQGKLKAITRRTKIDIVNLARTMGPDALGVLKDIMMSKKYAASDRRGAAEQILRWGFGAPVTAVTVFNQQNNINNGEASSGAPGTKPMSSTDDLLAEPNNPLAGLDPEKRKAYLIEYAQTLAESLGPKPDSTEDILDNNGISPADEFRADAIETEAHRIEDQEYLNPAVPSKPKAIFRNA